MAQMQKNKPVGKITIARRVVQVCALLLFCVPLFAAGWTVLGMTAASDSAGNATPAQLPFFGTLSSTEIGPFSIIDPFAVLQTICASKTVALEWIVGAAVVVVVYGLIRGRVFCGWTCPVNLLCEIVDWLRRKLKIKVAETPVPRHAKIYIAGAVLVVSALVSIPVFEVVSPLSLLNKGLVLGSTTGLVTLIAIIVAELFFGHRVWCRSICPLGGFYEVLGRVGQINVKIDHEDCIGCNKCKQVCLCDPAILADAIDGRDTMVRAGDCMLCGKCVEACPKDALYIQLTRDRKPSA